jgi:prephenate dehydrogenase
MRLFNKVAIVGTGLVGGSLALAIKKKKLAKEIVGVSRRKSSVAYAKRIGAIDYGSTDQSIIRGADLVILATPVGAIVRQAGTIRKFIDRDTIVTDVGSTKEDIVRKLEKIFPLFVGSHPIAGSEKNGIINAQADLFTRSMCILTPTSKTKSAALKKVSLFWKEVGASVNKMSPALHDKTLALTSHLPHLLAFALIASVPRSTFRFSSGGLKGSTRIAASGEELWSDIFLTNRKNITAAAFILERNLKKLNSAITKRNRAALLAFLRKAKKKRIQLG